MHLCTYFLRHERFLCNTTPFENVQVSKRAPQGRKKGGMSRCSFWSHALRRRVPGALPRFGTLTNRRIVLVFKISTSFLCIQHRGLAWSAIPLLGTYDDTFLIFLETPTAESSSPRRFGSVGTLSPPLPSPPFPSLPTPGFYHQFKYNYDG
jgi:hypothetical protein